MISMILARKWVEDKLFFTKNYGVYMITNLRGAYIYAMDLMCRLYDEPNCFISKMHGYQLKTLLLQLVQFSTG
jgi:hypothetical protein